MVRARVEHPVDRAQVQAGRPAQPSAADSPSSSHPRKGFCEASRAFRFLRCTAARVAPEGVPGQAHIHEPRGSAPRERDHRGGDRPGPIPNPAVKPAFAESTAAPGCGRAGRRARGGRFSIRASGRGGRQGPRGDPVPPRALLRYGASMRAACSAFRGRLLLRAGRFRARGPAACGLVLRSGGGHRFLHAGPFLVQGGAHALSAALCIYKGRRRNAICGRRWNSKREAVDHRASWQAANLRASRRWAAASLLVSL